jgi:hypothetical protein
MSPRTISLALITACGPLLAAEPPSAPLDPAAIAADPVRYLENDRLKLGIDLRAGGAVTYLEDKRHKSGNMVNSFDWGRQIQLSFYSGPQPFIGPNGEAPDPTWAGLGWNPVQAGSVARVPSRTTAFERGDDFMRVRCIPMQFSHANIPADCDFEATYRLLGDNAVEMRGRIINRRLDKTQYPARSQEMPAIYTNGPWYRLITYLGDAPFTEAPPTTIVGKDDVKGWPHTAWAKWHAPEHWAALVNEEGWGVGLFQPETCSFGGGFAGGNELKGTGGPQDCQTGYLTAGAMRILDHNIDLAYTSHIIVGTLEEIRAHAGAQPRQPLAWKFASDRLGWIYDNATDAGWPIHDGLKITHKAAPRGTMISDEIHWQAADAPILEIEAAFTAATPTVQVDVEIQPFEPADRTDFPAWEVPSPAIIEETARKKKTFPSSPPIIIPLTVPGDGQPHTHGLKLSENPAYRGAMKQLRLHLPATDGTADVRRIELRR